MATKFNLGDTVYRFVCDNNGFYAKDSQVIKITITGDSTYYILSDGIIRKEDFLFESVLKAVENLVSRCLPQYELIHK